jgi:hypothetical protein
MRGKEKEEYVMTDFDKWLKTDIAVAKKADIEKEENFRKEIMNLVKERYHWELENRTLSLLDPNVILVKTDVCAGTGRPYAEINKFKDELASILQKYDLEIKEFDSDDKTISNDSKYRRIEIELKRRI